MPEQGPSKFESLKQSAKGAFEGVMNFAESKLALGLIGAVGLVGGGVAIANQLSVEPANAANVPEATSSDLQQDCVDAALQKPKVAYPNLGYAYMIYPGDKRRQAGYTYGKFKATSAACLQEVTPQAPTVVFRVQNPNNHKRFSKTKPLSLTINDANGDRPMQGGEGGIAGTSSEGFGKNKGLRYRCTPGKNVTHVQAVYQMEVDSPVDGHVLGHKSYTVPARVHPVAGIVLGGGVKKAC